VGLINEVPNIFRSNVKRWLTQLQTYYGLHCEYFYPIRSGSFYMTEDAGCEYDSAPAASGIDVVVGKGILRQRFKSDASLDMFVEEDTIILLPHDRTLPKDTKVKVYLEESIVSGSLFQEFRVERIESVYSASGAVINKAILWPFNAPVDYGG